MWLVIVDTRAGSNELLNLLKRKGVPAVGGRLDFGDISFVGNGPDGCPVPIGVEYKKIHDVLKCVVDGRFAGHQLPGLASAYTYRWLLVEGRYRPDARSGVLQVMAHRGYWHDAHIGGRAFMYRELDGWLLTMELRAGIKVYRTYDQGESVHWLADLYHWWTDKEWETHRSHLAFDESDANAPRFVKPSLIRRIAKELPGIGWEKSAGIAKRFCSVVEMACAEEEDFRSIEGIGPKIAAKIVSQLRGGN